MKVTKKQRKLRDGMNHATLQAFNQGYQPPKIVNVNEGQPLLPRYMKVAKGVPYVNPLNFGIA